MLSKWKNTKGKAVAWWKQAPASIKAAVVLLLAIWAAYATFVWRLQRTMPVPTSTHPVTGLLMDCLIEVFLLAQLGFGLYVIALIGRKRAIGRFLVMLLFVGFSAFWFRHLIRPHVNMGTTLFLMLGASSVLLVTRESRIWFRSRKTNL
ncbi:hypothetical protein N0A02_12845 [Paraburkholderia acidicola]|uniref:DoxX-like protein n=1 Tax=Paraburkholderia acidicola TaxID=1912599 RepID=A0ABV1LM69_9BURK